MSLVPRRGGGAAQHCPVDDPLLRRLPYEPLAIDLFSQIDVEPASDQQHLREYVSQLGPKALFDLGSRAPLVSRLPCTREVRLRQFAHLFVEFEHEPVVGALDAVALRVEHGKRSTSSLRSLICTSAVSHRPPSAPGPQHDRAPRKRRHGAKLLTRGRPTLRRFLVVVEAVDETSRNPWVARRLTAAPARRCPWSTVLPGPAERTIGIHHETTPRASREGNSDGTTRGAHHSSPARPL